MQHSITPRGEDSDRWTGRWLEEGIANIFTKTKVFRTRNQQAAGLTQQAYAGALGREPEFDLGWGRWTRPVEQDKAAAAVTSASLTSTVTTVTAPAAPTTPVTTAQVTGTTAYTELADTGASEDLPLQVGGGAAAVTLGAALLVASRRRPSTEV